MSVATWPWVLEYREGLDGDGGWSGGVAWCVSGVAAANRVVEVS